ncbi:MAG TPA: hydrogenase 3 maturation endopeptidase HyCI, partial [Anaerolineales bacterium]|nr:hydrogenase 3 maturation endopeptidase HyCI [Anaerolineales bacterium]
PLPKDLSPLSAERVFARSNLPGGEGGQGGEGGTSSRLAVVGVGRAGRGDDAAGPALCAELARLERGREDLLVLDAGIAPENVGGALRRFHPTLVVLVDAAEMGMAPGAVRRLDRRKLPGCSASTHTVPLDLLARFLSAYLECRVSILGIQPGRLGADGPLSRPVARAVRRLARHLSAEPRTGHD